MQSNLEQAVRQKYLDKSGEDQPWYEQWWQAAKEEAADVPLTKQIETLTSIPPILSVTVALCFILWRGLSGAYNDFLLLCLCNLYPMLKSVRALQTENDPDDDKIWLTYWCVYGFITVFDKYEFDFLLEGFNVYILVKVAVYLWLQVPGKWMGSRIIYKYIFKPIYNLCGEDLNYYANRSHEELYDFNKEVSKSLNSMKGVAGGAALNMAMTMHETETAEKSKDK